MTEVSGLTYSQIAEAYGITVGAVDQIAARHRYEIDEIRHQVAAKAKDELIGVWIADRMTRAIQCQLWAEAMDDVVTDERATTQDRIRAAETGRKLVHTAAELLGELNTRTKLELDTGGLPVFGVLIQDADGNYHGVKE